MNQPLHVLLAGNNIGLLRQDQGRANFTYAAAWRQSSQAIPLSLTIPLAAAEHGFKSVEPYLWGLLPDNEQVLERWAKAFHVSPRNAFALLSNVGEDCAGAVQFVRTERLDANAPAKSLQVQWLDEAAIAQRLANLRQDHSAWRAASDLGQFSLPGAQPKTALLYLDGRWGVPSGRTPTTHILKPPIGAYEGHAENEHFCLLLAKTLNLPAANSEVRRFGDETAIVVERYDRVKTSSLAAAAAAEAAAAAAATALDPEAIERVTDAAARASMLGELAEAQPYLRLHQEDLCQAMGLLPVFKYQNEGGPTPRDIVQLLRAHSSRPREDVETFLAALTFNWLIAGPDAHAKNYSLLHGGGGRVRLAPLYDIASILPFGQVDLRRVKLAMKIGGAYELESIGPRQWRKLASEVEYDSDRLLQSIAVMAAAMPEAVAETKAAVEADGLKHPIVGQLAERLTARARHCLQLLSL